MKRSTLKSLIGGSLLGTMLMAPSIHLTANRLDVAISVGFAQANASRSARPEKMDVETHRFLIEKLQAVLAKTPKGDATRVPALLRLADLFSERARLLAMQEIERGCFQDTKADGCGVSQEDRKNAIRHYEMALEESSGANQSRILFQLAHLYEVDGNNAKAASLYRRILSMGSRHFSQTILGQSQAGLGEIAFKEKRFRDAKQAFELALKNGETPRKGWVHYRIAWSDLNLNQAEAGKKRLIMILKTPALLSLESTSGSNVDQSFREDIARDLTIFYARTGFNQGDINTLWTLSPDIARKSILMELAEEAERLGQKRSAIAVWSTLASRGQGDKNGLSTRERIEAHARVATLRFGLGEKAVAVQDFKGAIDLWQKQGCSPEAECSILERRLRKLVLDWNKNEETKLSRELLEMYRLYAGRFPHDPEMAFWGANVARELKANREAMALYHQAAEEASKQVRSGKFRVAEGQDPKKEEAKVRTVFEGSLLSEIEMAELTNDLKLREQAYTHYLALNANGPKSLEVRYQLAHVAYQRGDHEKAADQFYVIAARDEQCRGRQVPGLCRQAADLALDAMGLLKKEERLEAVATEFMKLYPAGEAEFSGIARRARLNMAAKAANGSSQSEMTENLKKLGDLNLKTASRSEVLLTHTNRFVLAEKTRNFAEANKAAVAIINFPGATEAERQDALAKRLWVAEMQLDFPTAYVTARQMTEPKNKAQAAERELKLALLAELSGRDPKAHLQKFIVMTKDRKAELAARVKLLKLAGFSVAEFNRHFDSLRRDTKVFADIGLEVYARNPSPRLAKRLLDVRGVSQTFEGGVLVRAGELKSVEAWAKRLAGQKLPAKASDRALQNAIAARVKALNDAGKFANKVIQSKDGWLQALALQVVAVENRRLKAEILELPAPKGLKEADVKRYQDLIAKQVVPFEVKALKIDQKLKAFWSTNPGEALAGAIEESSGARRTLLTRETRSMVSILDIAGQSDISRRLNRAMASEDRMSRASNLASSRSGRSALESARASVRKDPFDVDYLRRLRTLEAEVGRETMVSYIDSRMNRLGVKP
ncbi:MAG: hypothetical protein RBT63_06205 [Bdellovibrionales bacterium]|nr:hypothetical protein [Bdellovibrionales bacterium]